MAKLPIEAARERLEERDKALLDGTAVYGPDPQPCVCGAPRWEHGGEARSGKCPRTRCVRYRRDVVDALVEKAEEGRRAWLGQKVREHDRLTRAKREGERDDDRAKGVWHIGASDALGDPSDPDQCRRKIMYREKGLPEGYTRDWEDKRAAWLGGLIHDAVMRIDQVLYPWRLFEQVVHIDGLDGRSRYDDYDPITQVLNDSKTAGSWKWDKVGVMGPTMGNWEQVMMYALALNRDGKPVKTVRITYIARDNGKDEVFERPYDEAFALAAVNKLTAVATALDMDEELPRDFTGPSNHPLCRLCPFRTACWNLDKAERVGRSGESVTILGVDPNVEQIEWALFEIITAREEETAARNRVDEKKSLVDGIEPGTYGLAELTAGSRGKENWKAYAETLREFWALPEDERPRLDTIQVPRYPNTRPSAKKLRKAERDRILKEREELARAQAAGELRAEEGGAA
jgi:CRISPR/Cas system-associated exonuclease Cas4 (RecB family)